MDARTSGEDSLLGSGLSAQPVRIGLPWLGSGSCLSYEPILLRIRGGELHGIWSVFFREFRNFVGRLPPLPGFGLVSRRHI